MNLDDKIKVKEAQLDIARTNRELYLGLVPCPHGQRIHLVLHEMGICMDTFEKLDKEYLELCNERANETLKKKQY